MASRVTRWFLPLVLVARLLACPGPDCASPGEQVAARATRGVAASLPVSLPSPARRDPPGAGGPARAALRLATLEALQARATEAAGGGGHRGAVDGREG